MFGRMRQEAATAEANRELVLSLLSKAVQFWISKGKTDPKQVAALAVHSAFSVPLPDGVAPETVMLWDHSAARTYPDANARRLAKNVTKQVPKSLPPHEYKRTIAELWASHYTLPEANRLLSQV